MPKETSKNSTNHNACIGVTPVAANVPIFFTRIFPFTHVATAISKKQAATNSDKVRYKKGEGNPVKHIDKIGAVCV
jgi:hypothetical protein